MTEYDNTNRGGLFRNDRKDSDRHPDYQGSINVNGVDYWLSAWLKTKRDGAKFMSLSVKPKTGDAHDPARDKRSEPPRNAIDDEIPF